MHPEPLRGAAREPRRGAVRGLCRHVGRRQEHGRRVQEVFRRNASGRGAERGADSEIVIGPGGVDGATGQDGRDSRRICGRETAQTWEEVWRGRSRSGRAWRRWVRSRRVECEQVSKGRKKSPGLGRTPTDFFARSLAQGRAATGPEGTSISNETTLWKRSRLSSPESMPRSRRGAARFLNSSFTILSTNEKFQSCTPLSLTKSYFSVEKVASLSHLGTKRS